MYGCELCLLKHQKVLLFFFSLMQRWSLFSLGDFTVDNLPTSWFAFLVGTKWSFHETLDPFRAQHFLPKNCMPWFWDSSHVWPNCYKRHFWLSLNQHSGTNHNLSFTLKHLFRNLALLMWFYKLFEGKKKGMQGISTEVWPLLKKKKKFLP